MLFLTSRFYSVWECLLSSVEASFFFFFGKTVPYIYYSQFAKDQLLVHDSWQIVSSRDCYAQFAKDHVTAP